MNHLIKKTFPLPRRYVLMQSRDQLCFSLQAVVVNITCICVYIFLFVLCPGICFSTCTNFRNIFLFVYMILA
uniref:Uncharacterized protein n=1 Tax=Anguilla anguilla TaxID=7936 RepID=A0A0E9PI89_ANGAN